MRPDAPPTDGRPASVALLYNMAAPDGLADVIAANPDLDRETIENLFAANGNEMSRRSALRAQTRLQPSCAPRFCSDLDSCALPLRSLLQTWRPMRPHMATEDQIAEQMMHHARA